MTNKNSPFESDRYKAAARLCSVSVSIRDMFQLGFHDKVLDSQRDELWLALGNLLEKCPELDLKDKA